MRWRKLMAGLSLTAIVAGAVHAECPEPELDRSDPEDRQGLLFSWENDQWSGGNPTDSWYTNGLHWAWAYKRYREPELLKPLVNGLRSRWQRCGKDTREPGLTLVANFGQTMYTPRYISKSTPQVDDRPWGAWLYGGLGISTYDGYAHHMAALKTGPVGPLALGGPVQTAWHSVVKTFDDRTPLPEGWHNQLRARWGVQFSYQYTQRAALGDYFGAHASGGVSLGNLRKLARGSLGVVFSPTARGAHGDQFRLPPGTLDEGEFNVPDFNHGRTDGSWSGNLKRTLVYANVQLSRVESNYFLEGDTYAGRSHIAPIHRLTTWTIGWVKPFGDQGEWRLGYAFKLRSPEFKSEGFVRRDFHQRWGVISISHDYNI